MTRKINNSYELGQSNAPDTGGDMLKTRADGTLVWEGVADTTFIPPTWYGGRGIFAGGGNVTSVNTIEYITIATPGNATDFGDLLAITFGISGLSNGSRGVFGLGGPAYADPVDTIEYITIATTGNSTDFGNATTSTQRNVASCSNGTRGVFGRGALDYITIDTTGNATDFGDLTVSRSALGGCNDSTRGIFAGGGYTIDYITIATTGNAIDFGDMSYDAKNSSGACSDTSRGVFGGGKVNGGSDVDTIEYITIQTTGNATDFGNLTAARKGYASGSISDGTYGIFGAPYTDVTTIEYITIQTTGNSIDFGDLTISRVYGNTGGTSGD